MTVPNPVRSIVVGVDESDGAAAALRWAVRERDLHDAKVTAVMAWGFLDQHHTLISERFDPSYGEEAGGHGRAGRRSPQDLGALRGASRPRVPRDPAERTGHQLGLRGHGRASTRGTACEQAARIIEQVAKYARWLVCREAWSANESSTLGVLDHAPSTSTRSC